MVTPGPNQPPTPPNPSSGTPSPIPVTALPLIRHSKDAIQQRRDMIKSLLDKGVQSHRKISALLGVSGETIRRDLKQIREEGKSRISKRSAHEHVLDMLGQIEESIRSSVADYMALKDSGPRAAAVRAQLQQTVQRAIALKFQLLTNTGVIPTDVTNIDRIIEAEGATEKSKRSLDARLQDVVSSSESRRKVLDVVDRLMAVPPDMAQKVLNTLNAMEDSGDHPAGRAMENDTDTGGAGTRDHGDSPTDEAGGTESPAPSDDGGGQEVVRDDPDNPPA